MRKSEELARRWMPGFRQGPENRPAWAHPQDLVNLLAELPGERSTIVSERLIDVCWMHDLIEDGVKEDGSKVRQQDLLGQFPFNTVMAVVDLSQREGEEKLAYYARLLARDCYTVEVAKCLDRICNLREGAPTFKDKRWARYVGETQEFILRLADRVPEPEGPWLKAKLLETMALRPVVK